MFDSLFVIAGKFHDGEPFNESIARRQRSIRACRESRAAGDELLSAALTHFDEKYTRCGTCSEATGNDFRTVNDEIFNSFDLFTSEVWRAFAVANCANGRLVEKEVPQKEQRISRQKGRPVINRFYVLRVTQRLTSPGSSAAPGENQTPYHGVRGCWPKYGPKFNRGKLFGKYEGIFYRPAHYRGRPAHGTVSKDYSAE
jgi:hypothetical protein